jgi:hypothetical protein
MPKKLLAATAIAAVVITTLFAFRPNANKCTEEQVCCKKNNQPCTKKQEKAADDVILENLSRQFITITPSGF